jgi:hypothetical protein
MNFVSVRSLAIVAVIGAGTLPAWAGPVEYVRVCDTFGAGYFYIPGSDACMNANTGTTKQLTNLGTYTGESEMAARFNDAFEGIAVSAAMPQPYIPAGQHFAIAGNWGQFQGNGGSTGYTSGGYSGGSANALGIGAAMRINDNLTFSAAGAIGLERKTWATRVGFNMSW